MPHAFDVRTTLKRAALGAALGGAALVSVGLTAAPGNPFVITIAPALLRVDDSAGDQRAAIFAADVDIKLASAHLHLDFPGIPLPDVCWRHDTPAV